MVKTFKSKYNGVVVLDAPINIMDDNGLIISIYGLLYEKDSRHSDDLWQWQLQRYLSYLLGCVRVQENGCKIAPDLWVMEDGNMIPLGVAQKNLIHKVMKKEIQPYRIVEYDQNLQFYEDEVEDMFVISQAPFIRFKISDTKNGKEVKE